MPTAQGCRMQTRLGARTMACAGFSFEVLPEQANRQASWRASYKGLGFMAIGAQTEDC